MFLNLPALLLALAAPAVQQPGSNQGEWHEKLLWSNCTSEGTCHQVKAEIVLDSNWRWIHKKEGYETCFQGGHWDRDICSTVEGCTANCTFEGASYEGFYGIKGQKNSLSMKFRTDVEYGTNIGSRVFLMANRKQYQTFTLANNEIAFNVDLSSVRCGINSALYFVEMDADGGVARFPNGTSSGGAEYGMGYCDASCPRDLKYVAGKANSYRWRPSLVDPDSGTGYFGACCSQFSIWNSNARSYSMSSHTCPWTGYHICEDNQCSSRHMDTREACDEYGCNYNPYRMGKTDFYGKGKRVDTSRNFTVVTRFEETQVTQFIIQDGRKIETPPPTWAALPKEGKLSAEICEAAPKLFEPNERHRFLENGGWKTHKEYLSRPMVMVMSIRNDYLTHNRWLDSQFPPEYEGLPGSIRGDCPPDEDDPAIVNQVNARAKVIWSNIRFGPIGSTVIM